MKKKKLTIALATSVVAIGACIYLFGGKLYWEYSIDKLFNEVNDIKIIKETESIKDDNILAKLETYEDMIGYDWLNDNEILAVKENKKKKNREITKTIDSSNNGITVESIDSFSNLGIYNLNNKNIEFIAKKDTSQAYVVSSPDQKHIFYVDCINPFKPGTKAYIADLKGNIKAKIDAKNMSLADFDKAKWINNDEVIMRYDSIKGFAILNINGSLDKIENVENWDMETQKNPFKGSMINYVDKVGDNIYYTHIDLETKKDRDKMKIYNLKTKETKNFIEENVADFQVSPNKKQILITKEKIDKKGNIIGSEMVITDLQGKNEELIYTENMGIPYGQCWAPDSTKISYIGSKGVKMYDLKTKKNYLVISGEYYTPTNWSPSSKKIMVHTTEKDKNGYVKKENTSIITLK
ncbi:hypothetical protein [Clostridium tarantellae]|uniref:Dipeptidylpeptidase IV N-terminal domain-containing protein n=1 Tax=Clostridium tarantellae TaxID=39493 RepID=A0A6I1MTA5_9CLOT|nr:hypothetical protein [Clostridium tarantellae]MPQ44101.1 hypothetical protein [Clostridium tarantellae]